MIKEKISPIVYILCLYILCIYFINDKYLGITKYYYFPLLMIGFFIIELILGEKIKFDLNHLVILLLIIFVSIKTVVLRGSINTGIIFSYLLQMILYLVLTMKKFNMKEVKYTENAYILSALIISFIIAIFRNPVEGWIGFYRYTIRIYNGEYVDPNFLASFMLMPAFIIFNRCFYITNRLISFLIFTIISFGIFMTGSRAAIIVLIFGVFLILSNYIKINLRKIIYLSIGILCILVLMKLFVPEELISRVFFKSYSDGSNSRRISNWIMGVKCFIKSPIVGLEFWNSPELLNYYMGYNYAIHNTFLVFLNHFGVLGCSLIIILLGNMLFFLLKGKDKVLIASFVGLLVTSVIIEQNYSITFWLILVMLKILEDSNYAFEENNIE